MGVAKSDCTPVLTPRLSSYWIHLVTPVPASLARPLAEGLRNEVVCRDHRIRELIPQELLDCRTAIRLALEDSQRRMESRWTDDGQTPPVEWVAGPIRRTLVAPKLQQIFSCRREVLARRLGVCNLPGD
jgi:hypothetical protein